MVTTARCTRIHPDSGDFDDRNSDDDDDDGILTTCHCMKCWYSAGTVAPHAAETTRGRKTTTKAAAECCDDSDCDSGDPPSEAAAFVASATAAVFVLLVALLAVVLSSAAVLTFASLVPTAVAAATVDVRGCRQPAVVAADYHSPQQQPYQWHSQQQNRQRAEPQRYDDASSRHKRQLFKNREPGIISLTFSLIGGTVTDVKQAFRNVSGIVQETLAESAREPTTSTSAPVDGDQMMAAGNAAENEIGGSAAASTTAATPPVDQSAVNREVRKLFGRNYRGLRRLFDSELRSAIKSSPGNIRDFTLELVGAIGQSLRPSRLFTRGPMNGNNATAASS